MKTEHLSLDEPFGVQDEKTSKPKPQISQIKKSYLHTVLNTIAWLAPKLTRVGPLRRSLMRSLEKRLYGGCENLIEQGRLPCRVATDRRDVTISIVRSLGKAMGEGRLSPAVIRKLLRVMVGDVLINKGDISTSERFIEKYKIRPPEMLLISPTKACNLRCKGCYADSKADKEKLTWPVFEKMVQDAHDLWGARFIIFSGGEPLMYKDQGKKVLDLVEKFDDCFFMMYTNGTLIDDKIARRMGELGNIMPAISVEGLREQTDARRGEGVFDQVIAAIERLRREKVLYGVSFTATRENAEVIFSDEVVDFFFEEMGAVFGWVFHYMPIGRAITLEQLPTPEQRLWMWKRCWELISDRHLFILDFWNSASASQGCISAGRGGGYMCVDWNGNVSPCVFMPYSPVNFNDIYAQGKTMNDVWEHPFFDKLRTWQFDYGYEKKFKEDPNYRNWMMPCPIRDHYAEFYEMQKEYDLTPIDENAREAIEDPEYRKGMIAYNKAVADLLDPIWEKEYLGHRDKEIS